MTIGEILTACVGLLICCVIVMIIAVLISLWVWHTFRNTQYLDDVEVEQEIQKQNDKSSKA